MHALVSVVADAPSPLVKTDSQAMKSIDSHSKFRKHNKGYDFPNTLEGFKYGFNESKFHHINLLLTINVVKEVRTV